MRWNGGIQVEEVPNCLFCGKSGKPLYDELRDRVSGSPGLWGFWECPACGFVWLNPRPLPEELPKVYAGYHTHYATRKPRYSWLRKTRLGLYSALPGYASLAKGSLWRVLGRMLLGVPPLREDAMLGTMCLDGRRKGRLLDVGCGNGHFLALMKTAGWDVLGVENDPDAARVARDQYGVPVVVGTVPNPDLSGNSFDAVTLHHVIEHVYNPVALLRECGRLLNTEGRVVVVTPNVQSMAHRLFGKAWRRLEPPRHLFLWNPRTLRECAERSGLKVLVARSSARIASWIWAVSKGFESGRALGRLDVSWSLRLRGFAFQLREQRALSHDETAGEEVLLIACRA